MSAVRHTPGPWIVDPDYPDDIQTRDRKEIGVAFRPDACGTEFKIKGTMGASSYEEALANSRLIAAAPDLLSIVQRFVALSGGSWDVARHARDEADLMEEARAAIAKATGAV